MAAETGRATQVARAAGATVGLATMITGMAACAAEFIRKKWIVFRKEAIAVGPGSTSHLILAVASQFDCIFLKKKPYGLIKSGQFKGSLQNSMTVASFS